MYVVYKQKKKKKRIFERVSVFVSKKFMRQRFSASNMGKKIFRIISNQSLLEVWFLRSHDRSSKSVGEFENARKMKEIYFTCQYLNNLGYLIKKIKNGRESLKLRNGGYWRKLSHCRSDHVLLWFLFAEKSSFRLISFIFVQCILLDDFYLLITYFIKCN